MASKADRLKQKALSVVDTVQTLSSSTDSSNSCTITVKVGERDKKWWWFLGGGGHLVKALQDALFCLCARIALAGKRKPTFWEATPTLPLPCQRSTSCCFRLRIPTLRRPQTSSVNRKPWPYERVNGRTSLGLLNCVSLVDVIVVWTDLCYPLCPWQWSLLPVVARQDWHIEPGMWWQKKLRPAVLHAASRR